jgi:hypothetical protein
MSVKCDPPTATVELQSVLIELGTHTEPILSCTRNDDGTASHRLKPGGAVMAALESTCGHSPATNRSTSPFFFGCSSCSTSGSVCVCVCVCVCRCKKHITRSAKRLGLITFGRWKAGNVTMPIATRVLINQHECMARCIVPRLAHGPKSRASLGTCHAACQRRRDNYAPSWHFT